MAAGKRIRLWFLVHKWTSLVCTVFMLLLCITGLPLIFTHEIDDLLSGDPPYAELPANAPRANLDRIIEASRARYPAEAMRFIFIDDEEPQVVVTMSPSTDSDPKHNHSLKFDARTSKLISEKPPEAQSMTFMGLMLRLHIDLFAGLAGELFLGFMGLLLVIAIASGVVLYGPFMKKLDFGTVREGRSARLKWLDLHNLLGIATLAWAFVVGLTGVINELSTPLFQYWQSQTLPTLLAPYQGKTMPPQSETASVQGAYESVRRAMPDSVTVSVVYPTEKFGSPQHFIFWNKGNTPLTSRLFTPALLDARSGAVAAIPEPPWYLKALEVSRPLHFGDYAGTPLKILWAVLDVITIIVLGSGLYLWIARRKQTGERLAQLERRHEQLAGAAARAS
jgi:uncharacterized iron-regulated membrane protein